MDTAVGFILLLMISIVNGQQSSNEESAVTMTSPNVSNDHYNTTTLTTTNDVTAPMDMCPKLIDVRCERGRHDVTLCWTLSDGWNKSDSSYEIAVTFETRNDTLFWMDTKDNCRAVDIGGLGQEEDSVEYCIGIQWRSCLNYTCQHTCSSSSSRAVDLTAVLVVVAISTSCLILIVIYTNRKRCMDTEAPHAPLPVTQQELI